MTQKKLFLSMKCISAPSSLPCETDKQALPREKSQTKPHKNPLSKLLFLLLACVEIKTETLCCVA